MPTYFLLPESRQRAGPCCPVPPALPAGKPAPSSSCGCAAKLTARRWRSVQTRCRKLDDEAVALCGATASPKNLPSQAWAKGAKPDSGSWIVSRLILIAATAWRISARSQFRHNSCRPSAPESTRVSTPAARGSGCGQRCRRTALLRALTCRRLFERSAASAQRVGRHRSLNCVTQVCLERSET